MVGATAGTRVYIEGYSQFGGTHWESGSVRNVLAHQGVLAANGEPLSEAMLMGISGGVAVLYFVFEYEGHEPQVFIGTRYVEPAVDTPDTMYKRIGIEAGVMET